MWRRTVTGEIDSRAAISAVECPLRSIPSTCASREVSPSPAAVAHFPQLTRQLEHHPARKRRFARKHRGYHPQQWLAIDAGENVADRTGANAGEHIVHVRLGCKHDNSRL